MSYPDAEKSRRIKELEEAVATLESALHAHSLPPPLPPKGLPPSLPRGVQSVDGVRGTPQPPTILHLYHTPLNHREGFKIKHASHHHSDIPSDNFKIKPTAHHSHPSTLHQNSHKVDQSPSQPSTHHSNSHKVHQPQPHLGCHLLLSTRPHYYLWLL